MVDGALQDLADSDCIEFSSDSERVKSTALGRIASYYYLDHSTVGMVSTVLEGEGGDELQVHELCRYTSY
jgi:Sec63 Brl domain